MMIRAQFCLLAITAEMPEWNEIVCPKDFSSAETGTPLLPNRCFYLPGLS
jgi:hypothetical protein